MRMRSLCPPTAQELKEYTKVRDQIARALDKSLVFSDGEAFDAKNLATRLHQKLSPPANPYNRGEEFIPSESEYENYFARLQLQQAIATRLEYLERNLESIKVMSGLNFYEQQVKNQVDLLLTELFGPDHREKFEAQYQAVINHIAPQIRAWYHQPNLPPAIRDYFLTLLENPHVDSPRPADWQRFAKARAAQLLPPPRTFEEEGEDSIPTVEKVMQKSPPNSLEVDMRHYAVAQRFEYLLEQVNFAAHHLLVDELKEQVSLALAKPESLKPSLKAVFANLNKANLEWLEDRYQQFHRSLETPSMIFQQLKGLPEDEIRIRSALESHTGLINFLSVEDKSALDQASSDQQRFEQKLDGLILRYEQGTQKEALENLKQAASKPDPAAVEERPFVTRLYEKGMIDDETHARLNPSGGLPREAFLQTLGSREDFVKEVMRKFEQDLLHELDTPKREDISKRTTALLARFHIEALNVQAKRLYLNQGLFDTTPSYNFDKALEVFNPEQLQLLANDHTDDSQLLAKAYIQGLFYWAPAEEKYTSSLDEFLSRIKIPQDGNVRRTTTEKQGILARWPDFDRRLSAMYLEPLTEGDARLTGTPYARLTREGMGHINQLARSFYPSQHLRNQISLRDGVQEFEAQHQQHVRPILNTMNAWLRDPKIRPLHQPLEDEFQTSAAVRFLLSIGNKFKTYFLGKAKRKDFHRSHHPFQLS
ncbi:hypothetical protein VP01_116g5 [Puccinia sorghi]|uniref:Uncharacterized protein n=1 Tax=Puccinia sorghi TaxID=27349 RepID=A0A0L6VRH3_9BASI|nr:hypothetical protein VP01_116g5 [Puccinia sorghi]